MLAPLSPSWYFVTYSVRAGGALISQIVMFLLFLTGSLLFLTGREGGAGMWQGLPLSLICGVASALLFRTLIIDVNASQAS
jgi:hypothetical protein